MTNENFEILKQFMITNFNAKIASGGKEIVKRCHICGDSRDITKRHMYIGLRDGRIVYNCFKCNAHGMVDGKFFRDLGVFDISIIEACIKQNNLASDGTYKGFTSKEEIYRINNPRLMYREAPETYEKLAYINNRLNTNFTLSDMVKFKIILNLYDFLNVNEIRILSRDPRIVNELDRYFIGFLSNDNRYINLRRIVDKGIVNEYIDERYVNYNIYNSINNEGRYYTIPTKINPNERINFYISEGVFDILGVYFNTDSNKNNSLFASIGGKSYMSIVKYFILKYGFMVFDLHIYVDNDVDDYEIKKIKWMLSYNPNVRIFMHRNFYPGEKDFGVPKDRITEKIIQL